MPTIGELPNAGTVTDADLLVISQNDCSYATTRVSLLNGADGTGLAGIITQSGGTLSGPLTLAADPTSALEPATMQYADTKLPLAGGTLSGGVTIGDSASPLWNVGNLVLNGNCDESLSGFSVIQSRSTVYPTKSGASPVVNDWVNFTGLTVRTVSPVKNGKIIPNSGQHVAVVGQVDRYLPPHEMTQPSASVPMAQVWAYYGAVNDHTGSPSSLSGAMTFAEADLSANGADDARARFGFVGNFQAGKSIANGGLPAGLAYMFLTDTVDNDSIIYSSFYGAGAYASAVFDSRFAAAGRAGVTGTLVATAEVGAKSVVVSDVRPFLCGGDATNSPLSPRNTIENVLIGAHRYTVENVTVTAGERGGTLTLTSGLIAASDGVTGAAYGRVPAALWMQTGQEVVFDARSAYRLGFSTADNGMRLTGSGGLHMDGPVTAPSGSIGNFTAVNALSSLGPSKFHDGITMGGGLFEPTSVTFAALPRPGSGPANGLIWCCDALKPGEASGTGTGVLACPNKAKTGWLRVGDYTALRT